MGDQNFSFVPLVEVPLVHVPLLDASFIMCIVLFICASLSSFIISFWAKKRNYIPEAHGLLFLHSISMAIISLAVVVTRYIRHIDVDLWISIIDSHWFGAITIPMIFTHFFTFFRMAQNIFRAYRIIRVLEDNQEGEVL